MCPRFDLVAAQSEVIHFNLAGMNKEMIEKSGYLDATIDTGETAANWGKEDDSSAPKKTWKQQFGNFGITYWELAQILQNTALKNKTLFYDFNENRSSIVEPLTAQELKNKFGM